MDEFELSVKTRSLPVILGVERTPRHQARVWPQATLYTIPACFLKDTRRLTITLRVGPWMLAYCPDSPSTLSFRSRITALVDSFTNLATTPIHLDACSISDFAFSSVWAPGFLDVLPCIYRISWTMRHFSGNRKNNDGAEMGNVEGAWRWVQKPRRDGVTLKEVQDFVKETDSGRTVYSV